MAGVEKNSTHNPYVLVPVNASVVFSAPRPTLYQTDFMNQPAGPFAPQNSKDTGGPTGPTLRLSGDVLVCLDGHTL